MEALSTNVTLYSLFKSVFEAEDLYGEVSRECGMIVRDVEIFGEDLLTAMRNLQNITPSENFADLLNDLALVFRTGGNLKEFFDSRSDSYRELARQELEATGFAPTGVLPVIFPGSDVGLYCPLVNP